MNLDQQPETPDPVTFPEPNDPKLSVYRGADGRPYAVVNGRSLRIESREFRQVVRYELLWNNDAVPCIEEERAYIDRLLARARSAPQEPTYVRACRQGETLCIDLADDAGTIVEITRDGWRLSTTCSVRFMRPAGTRALVAPIKGGSFENLQRFVRLPPAAFRLLIANLTFHFCATAPHPILVLTGEQGVAKTSAAKFIQRVCDPRTPAVRQLPSSRRDLVIAASHSWLLSFDNVSDLKPWFSDALCTLATGGGYGARTSHTDSEETTFELARPVLLNGIGNLVTRDDLRDRCVFFDLDPIPEEERVAERVLMPEFDAALPGILGSLFDLCAGALRELPNVKPTRLPRMADFFHWALAVERAAGWPPGTMEQAYRDQRAASDVDAMEDALVAGLAKLTSVEHRWSGTATDLLTALRRDLSATATTTPWSKGAAHLGAELRRQTPLLRRNGIDVQTKRHGTARTIVLTRQSPAVPSHPSSLSPSRATSGGNELHVAGHREDYDTGDGTAVASEPAHESATLSEHDMAESSAGGDVSNDSPGQVERPTQAAVQDMQLEAALTKVTPPRFRALYRALHGKHLTPKEVCAAVLASGELPNATVNYVGQELAHGVGYGFFVRIGRGVYGASELP